MPFVEGEEQGVRPYRLGHDPFVFGAPMMERGVACTLVDGGSALDWAPLVSRGDVLAPWLACEGRVVLVVVPIRVCARLPG